MVDVRVNATCKPHYTSGLLPKNKILRHIKRKDTQKHVEERAGEKLSASRRRGEPNRSRSGGRKRREKRGDAIR